MWSSSGLAHSHYHISSHPSPSRLVSGLLMEVKYSRRITKLSKWHHLKWKERMRSAGGLIARGGFHQKKLLLLGKLVSLHYLLGLLFWLNITAYDDLIHNAHYRSLEMLIFSWVPNNCMPYINCKLQWVVVHQIFSCYFWNNVNSRFWIGMHWDCFIIIPQQATQTITRKQSILVTGEQWGKCSRAFWEW